MTPVLKESVVLSEHLQQVILEFSAKMLSFQYADALKSASHLAIRAKGRYTRHSGNPTTYHVHRNFDFQDSGANWYTTTWITQHLQSVLARALARCNRGLLEFSLTVTDVDGNILVEFSSE